MLKIFNTFTRRSIFAFAFSFAYACTTILLGINISNCKAQNAQQASQSAQGKVEQFVNIDVYILEVYKLIGNKQYKEAVDKIDQILLIQPNFALVHELKKDLLILISSDSSNPNSKTKILDASGQIAINLDNNTNENTNINNSTDTNSALKLEAAKRINAIFKPTDPSLIPRNLIHLSSKQKTAFVVDAEKSRLYVYENVNGRPKFLFNYYITIGKQGYEKEQEGDEKTPLGVYTLGSPIDKSKLIDLYGYGAMPLSFPNDWDKRNNISGTNIWLHGVPKDTYSRPPLASKGCIVLTNTDLQRLFKFAQVNNTPIAVNKSIEWLTTAQWKIEHDEAMGLLKSWQEAWDTYDFKSYVELYSSNMFKSDKKNYEQWMRKYAIFFEQKQLKIQNIRHASIYRYPATQPTLLITFEQDVMIPNILSKEKNAMKQSVLLKRQYWQYDGMRWEIVYENEN
jgi:murein L,D-transpeptidase YafK